MWRLLIIASLCAMGTLVFGCGPSKNDYITHNEALIETLSAFPSSSVVRTASSDYREDEHGPVVGYTTNVVYEVPSGTTADDVIEFYKRQLSSWMVSSEDIPVAGDDVVRIAHFRHGENGVSVNTDNLLPSGANTYELSVDYRRYRE